MRAVAETRTDVVVQVVALEPGGRNHQLAVHKEGAERLPVMPDAGRGGPHIVANRATKRSGAWKNRVQPGSHRTPLRTPHSMNRPAAARTVGGVTDCSISGSVSPRGSPNASEVGHRTTMYPPCSPCPRSIRGAHPSPTPRVASIAASQTCLIARWFQRGKRCPGDARRRGAGGRGCCARRSPPGSPCDFRRMPDARPLAPSPAVIPAGRA